MRFRGIRLPLLAAALGASVGLSLLATDRSYGQVLYVYPTSTTISLSTPYVLPTSYVVPSSYVFPSYVEAAYTVEPSVSLLPTGYIATTYRRGLFGRRWVVERPVVASYYSSAYVPTTYVSAYLPTTYVAPSYYATSYSVRRYRPTTYRYYPTAYYPTVYETAYNTTSDICCDTVAMVDAPVRTLPQSSAVSPGQTRSSKEVESSAIDDLSYPSVVDAPLPADNTKARSTLRGDQATNGGANRADSPPNPPAAGLGAVDESEKGAVKKAIGTPKNTEKQKAADTPASKKAGAPVAPADDADQIDLQPAPGNGEAVRRDSMRPRYSTLRGLDRRNILFGSVESDDGQPRPEVPVSVVNRTNRSVRRSGISDAFGGFAIRVPDGSWSVMVTMPSGNLQRVRDITVSGGRVVDNAEVKEVQNLIISY